MKYFALAMMAVLAMASVSMAGITYNVGPGTVTVQDGVPLAMGDLMSYKVSAAGFNVWQGLTLDGPVHQAHASWGVATPFDSDITSMGGTADALTYDTHAIKPVGYSSLGTVAIAETNAGGNSRGINTATFGTMSKVDMGTYATVIETGWYIAGTPEASYDFMQVVIPTGALVHLTGMLSTAAGTEHYLEGSVAGGIPIGIPEPGTVIMLVAGALCLLGIRRK